MDVMMWVPTTRIRPHSRGHSPPSTHVRTSSQPRAHAGAKLRSQPGEKRREAGEKRSPLSRTSGGTSQSAISASATCMPLTAVQSAASMDRQ